MTMKKMICAVQSLVLAMTMLFSAAASAQVSFTYLHNDALGSPVVATDENGAKLWEQAYKPYGQRYQIGDTNPTPKSYTGHVEDMESGLTYMQARYYNPVLGRFMAVDPIRFSEKNIHQFNRYMYGNGNPYRFIDPDGRDPFGTDYKKYLANRVLWNDIKNNFNALGALWKDAGIISLSGEGKLTAGPAGAVISPSISTTEASVFTALGPDIGVDSDGFNFVSLFRADAGFSLDMTLGSHGTVSGETTIRSFSIGVLAYSEAEDNNGNYSNSISVPLAKPKLALGASSYKGMMTVVPTTSRFDWGNVIIQDMRDRRKVKSNGE